MKSKFLDWFHAQFGPREYGSMQEFSDNALRDRVKSGESAKAALAMREEWDCKQQAALYAWNTGPSRAEYTKADLDAARAHAKAEERQRCHRIVSEGDLTGHVGYIETTSDHLDALAARILRD